MFSPNPYLSVDSKTKNFEQHYSLVFFFFVFIGSSIKQARLRQGFLEILDFFLRTYICFILRHYILKRWSRFETTLEEQWSFIGEQDGTNASFCSAFSFCSTFFSVQVPVMFSRTKKESYLPITHTQFWTEWYTIFLPFTVFCVQNC